ncbi:WD repeat-containing protein 6 [Anopheles nili]|uniref:WD repeat-containing protein 6 n=1 Tax=Anopheles nili TaxID=185578 RepID=UPI00237A53D8|nr:WD repeat-containing protein 6 [Anopheles nili]
MLVLTDAVCVRVLCSEKLLVANGNQLLLLFLTPSCKTRRTIVPTPRLMDKIHGIETCSIGNEKFLVIFHAGREAYSTTLDCKTYTFSECTRISISEEVCFQPVPHIRRRVNDWISCISLLSPTQLCIVTSHGVAVLLERNKNLDIVQWDFVEKTACEDGSTLYCSTIIGQRWEEALCFSGTALGLLLVWSVAGSKNCRGKVLASVSAHNGVIFSIACDLSSGLLTTTSDDRSVKFWNINIERNGGDIKGVILREERYCFAHTARVFQCRIIKSASQTLVASIGEDSHLCLWNPNGDLLLKKRLDEGPTLWSMDYDDEKTTIFVTASNGNLHKYCIRDFVDENSVQFKNCSDLVDISPVLETNEHLAKVKFLHNGSIVGVTNKNSAIVLDKTGKIVCTLKQMEFKCSIVDAEEFHLFLAGSKCIHVYDVSENNYTTLKTCKSISFVQDAFNTTTLEYSTQEGIIRSLNYCTRSKTVAVCDESGRCLILDEWLTTVRSCHRIPKSSERWITSFVALNEELLLLADRSGHLYLFDRLQVDPIFQLANVHGKLGITSITVDDALLTDEGYHLKTTGHDGRIYELFVNVIERKLEVLVFYKSLIGWIDRTLCYDNRRLYLGFNGSHFVMADDCNEIYTQFDCGGGHRCWDVFYNQYSKTLTYVFIQHKRLKMFEYMARTNTGTELKLPRFNWHTRACNTLEIARWGDFCLLLSGGEDNILRINTLANGEILEDPRKHLFNHISSIKTIVLRKHNENDTLIMVSAGGRAQICVTSIDLKSFRIKQECEYMLLATDLERSRWKTNRRSTIDPETKFMCAALIPNDRIVFGCSDGFVRIFQVVCCDRQWSVSPICETFYGRCILQVMSMDMHGDTIFVTMATDGYICFWNVSTPNEPVYRTRHHSSGVNAADVREMDDGKVLIATGGDDQSIVVSLFEISKIEGQLQIRLVWQVSEKYLHTAQVTGLKLLDIERLISVGVDQRVYVSKFSSCTQFEVISSTNTCVSDVKGLSLLPNENNLIIYGCGIEIINLSNFSNVQ